jgi:hypothetical protein
MYLINYDFWLILQILLIIDLDLYLELVILIPKTTIKICHRDRKTNINLFNNDSAIFQ